MELKLRLTGTRKLLMHNSRLANPLDPYTRELATLTSQQKKTLPDLAKIAQLEMRGGMYETPDAMLGLPMDNVWRAIWDAAKNYKLGSRIQQALPMPEVPLTLALLIEGKPASCDTWTEMLYVPGRVNRGKVMRARALIPEGWVVPEMSFEFRENVLALEKMGPVLEEAGRRGVCDWRPRYGTFTVEVLS